MSAHDRGVPSDGSRRSRTTDVIGPAVSPVRLRNLELALLVGAAVVTTAALMSVELDQQRALSASLPELGAAYLALFTVAHLAVRRWAAYADPLVLPIVAMLTGIGLVMIHRLDLGAAAAAAFAGEPAPASDAVRQVAWAAGSVVLLVSVIIRLPDQRVLARYGYLAGLVGLVLLVLPGILPASISEVNGAKLWIRLGPASLQPGEFAKLLVIVFAAALLVEKRELFRTAGRRVAGLEFPRARDLAPLLLAWLLAVGVLALEKELGASLLFFGIVLAMIYVATQRASWVLIGMVAFAGASVASYFLFSHVRVRVHVWENPFGDFANTGYQLSEGLFGLAEGGMEGTGLGSGHPNLVPLANTDFIVAGIGEELGLIGLAAVLVLYLVLIGRGLRAAAASRDGFSTLLGTGLSFSMALQVFVVVGGVTNLIPETGLTAPFLSYGGSSILANYVLVALLLRLSHSARRPAGPRPPQPLRTPLDQAPTELSIPLVDAGAPRTALGPGRGGRR